MHQIPGTHPLANSFLLLLFPSATAWPPTCNKKLTLNHSCSVLIRLNRNAIWTLTVPLGMCSTCRPSCASSRCCSLPSQTLELHPASASDCTNKRRRAAVPGSPEQPVAVATLHHIAAQESVASTQLLVLHEQRWLRPLVAASFSGFDHHTWLPMRHIMRCIRLGVLPRAKAAGHAARFGRCCSGPLLLQKPLILQGAGFLFQEWICHKACKHGRVARIKGKRSESRTNKQPNVHEGSSSETVKRNSPCPHGRVRRRRRAGVLPSNQSCQRCI